MPPADLKNLKLKDFLEHSVAASDVAEYGYCPATITNMLAIGKIRTPVMLEGSRLHEQDAQKILSGMRLKKVKVPETLIELLATMHIVVKTAMKSLLRWGDLLSTETLVAVTREEAMKLVE